MRSSLFHGPYRSPLAIGALALLGALGADVSAQDLAHRPRLTVAEANEVAARLVEEALTREMYGLDGEREAVLAKAEAIAPNSPIVRWQRGQMLIDGEWMRYDEVVARAHRDPEVTWYGGNRHLFPDTLHGHLELANQCAAKGLTAQERAHLIRVLTFDPDHAGARQRLGFVRVEEEWVGREEIEAAVAEEAAAQASLSRHRADFELLARLLSDERESVRQRTAVRLRAVRDVDAIPALERIVAASGEEASFGAIEALSNMPEKDATRSLARFAVLSPHFRVRSEAASLLSKRNFDHFVPTMVASMEMPLQTAYTFERRFDDARLVYRHVVYSEAARSAKLQINDVVYVSSQPGVHPIRLGTFDEDRIALESSSHFALHSALTEASVKMDNRRREEINANIGDALDVVTGLSYGTDARKWWAWWDQYEEVSKLGEKPTEVQYAWQPVYTSVQETDPQRPRRQSVAQRAVSCFAAGTPVLTNRGDVAIEQVRVGDLVLAQDVESGELAFQPVLETTIRPTTGLLRVEHEQGSFRCTPGHPFWVSGEGWVHAKRLRSGMELHTLEGSVRVSQVVADGSGQTYNLVVDRFANYFASEARILSHDNSSRRPTDAVVPGLMQK